MIRSAKQVRLIERKSLMGGNNSVFANVLLEDDEFTGAGRLFHIITIPPTSSVGYHQHIDETETYIVLEGEGIFNDNGTKVTVKVGDLMYTANGQYHGIENVSDKNLVIMALVLFDK